MFSFEHSKKSCKLPLMVVYKIVFVSFVLMLCSSNVTAQDWRKTSDGSFEVFTAARADDAHLSDVFSILREAKSDLRRTWGLLLPSGIQVYIHPNLDSYHAATELPWYVAAIANREEQKIDMQRTQVLLERDSLEKTLRHELFHLAQEDDLQRWQAEGRAMLFAGEEPIADAFDAIDAVELNHMLEGFVDGEGLARADFSRADFLKATATAYLWTQREISTSQP